ncbi:hypothetical protein CHS0354_021877 [Potamilus streckersoni]|uniref:Uncharacterized protein n=1 Tax=Potamilus streckersoni TaxID=2493646 RepID=A0AAE0TJT8_9BIVA|nr:hypothetical protein CHS0354_021877 [Potamilus streckersoni]
MDISKAYQGQAGDKQWADYQYTQIQQKTEEPDAAKLSAEKHKTMNSIVGHSLRELMTTTRLVMEKTSTHPDGLTLGKVSQIAITVH